MANSIPVDDEQQQGVLMALTNFGQTKAQQDAAKSKDKAKPAARKRSPASPVTKSDENASDDLLSAITNLGKLNKTPLPGRLQAGEADRRSRFWYRPTISFSEDVTLRKRASVPQEAQPMIDEIDRRIKTYSKELPPDLEANMIDVREFWLKEIAPLTLPAQAGSEHARSVITGVLGSDIDVTSFMQFQRMMGEAAKLKIAKFLTQYMGLDPSQVEVLLQSVAAKQTPREVVYVSPEADRRARPQPPEEKPLG